MPFCVCHRKTLAWETANNYVAIRNLFRRNLPYVFIDNMISYILSVCSYRIIV